MVDRNARIRPRILLVDPKTGALVGTVTLLSEKYPILPEHRYKSLSLCSPHGNSEKEGE